MESVIGALWQVDLGEKKEIVPRRDRALIQGALHELSRIRKALAGIDW